MRVLFFSNAFPQPYDPGRAVFNVDLLRQLAPGHELRAIVPVHWVEALQARARGRLPADTPALCPVTYPLFIYPPRVLASSRAAWLWLSTRSAVADVLRDWRPDVVLSYWAHPDGAVAMRLARKIGARGVLMTGGSDVLVLAGNPRRRKAVAAALCEADAVLTVSEALQSHVVELGVPAGRVHVMRRRVDPRHFSPGDRSTARVHLGIPADAQAVMWAGRLAKIKRVDRLLLAFREVLGRHSRARLYLLGEGPLQAQLTRLTRELGLDDAVTFVGRVAHDEVGEWLRAADLVALSSESEGTPNVLLEAIACDVPFVSTDVGGVREIADPARDRLVPVHDTEALAAAMCGALADRDRPPARRGERSQETDVAALLSEITMQEHAESGAAESSWTGRPSPIRQAVRRTLAATVPRRYFLVSGRREDKRVYLTFDDGPHPEVTPLILDALAEAGARATFFVVGRRARLAPDLVRRIVNEGHEVALHSHNHREPRLVSARVLCDEMRETARTVEAAGATPLPLVRPPFGKVTAAKLFGLWANGYGVVLWNVDPRDYRAKSGDEIVRWFDERPLGGGDVVLLHDTQPHTAAALPRILAGIRRSGLRFGTVSASLDVARQT